MKRIDPRWWQIGSLASLLTYGITVLHFEVTPFRVAAILSAFWMRVPPGRFFMTFGETVHRMRWPLFTIAVMLALVIVVCVTAVATLGTNSKTTYAKVATTIGGTGS